MGTRLKTTTRSWMHGFGEPRVHWAVPLLLGLCLLTVPYAIGRPPLWWDPTPVIPGQTLDMRVETSNRSVGSHDALASCAFIPEWTQDQAAKQLDSLHFPTTGSMVHGPSGIAVDVTIDIPDIEALVGEVVPGKLEVRYTYGWSTGESDRGPAGVTIVYYRTSTVTHTEDLSLRGWTKVDERRALLWKVAVVVCGALGVCCMLWGLILRPPPLSGRRG